MTQTPDLAGLPVAVFGIDLTEPAQMRRIRSLIALGCEVTSFCQRREGSPDIAPDWRNIDLGLVRHGDIKGRALAAAQSVRLAMGGWRQLAGARVIIARNLDMALIALAARRLAALRAGSRPAPLVYECLDIHDLMTRPGRAGQAMRAAERHVLGQSALLVTSSPGFLREYFQPMQNYHGPVALVENKLWLGLDPASRPPRPEARPRAEGAPLTIGLVGSIRCQASVDLLLRTTDLMGDRLRVKISGALHEHALSGFHQAIAARPNVLWTGPYAYPQGLADAYAGCDLVWAQDLWQRGTNSDWLLPNRIYEASWCGCPSVALSSTETGRRIRADGLGHVIDTPTPEALAGLLSRLTLDELAEDRAALLARPAGQFVQAADDVLPFLAPARTDLPAPPLAHPRLSH